jgi:hypothetical protein
MNKVVYILLFLTTISVAGWRWSDDSIFKHKDSSALHCIGSAYLANRLESVGLKPYQADILTLAVGTLWEVKDGLLPYEKHGYWGGEGFSIMDLICDMVGIITNRLIQLIIGQIQGGYE